MVDYKEYEKLKRFVSERGKILPAGFPVTVPVINGN